MLPLQDLIYEFLYATENVINAVLKQKYGQKYSFNRKILSVDPPNSSKKRHHVKSVARMEMKREIVIVNLATGAVLVVVELLMILVILVILVVPLVAGVKAV